jgi:hypothetical protein
MRTRFLHSAILVALLLASAGAQTMGRIGRSHFGSASSGGMVEAGSKPSWRLIAANDPVKDERQLAAAAYDAPTNSLIVFAGTNSTALTNDIRSLSSANGIGNGSWSIVIPNGAFGSPTARIAPTAVYDTANSRMIVFGGCTGDFCTAVQNDVWVLTDANGQSGAPTWIQLTPAGLPPAPRYLHSAAYDPVNNRMIIYGGENLLKMFSDTWVLSNANGLGGTPTWTQLSPSGGPPQGRSLPTIVYDPTSNSLIEFAGVSTSTVAANATNSVWTLSHANGLGGAPVWTNTIADGAAGSPPKRYGHLAYYDSANNCMMIFGGGANTSTGFPELDDVWVLTNANGVGSKPQWNKLNIGGTLPIRREWLVGGYDAANNRMMIYGGASEEGIFVSTWVLTHANGRP